MNLKPFNLEKALAGKPVFTNSERRVLIAGRNPDAHKSTTLIGWVEYEKYWVAMSWSDEGDHSSKDSSLDLYMLAEMKEYWIALLRKGGNEWTIRESSQAGISAKIDEAQKRHKNQLQVLAVTKIFEEEKP